MREGIVMPTKAEQAATIADLTAKLAVQTTTTVKAAKKSSRTRKTTSKRIPLADRPIAPMTAGISMTRRPESADWGTDHALLRFHDSANTAHAIGTRLNPEDTTGLELVEEIKSYASANRVGKSKIRFDAVLGAWKGRADMFPPRLREIAGYKINS